MHKTVFHNSDSSFALYTRNRDFITLYDYNNLSYIYMVFLYILHLTKLKYWFLANYKKPVDLREVDVKYCIYSHYIKTDTICYRITAGEDYQNTTTSKHITPHDLVYAVIDAYDVTEITKCFLDSITHLKLSVLDYADILYHLDYIPTLSSKEKLNMQVMNLNTMEENIFKANDDICL